MQVPGADAGSAVVADGFDGSHLQGTEGESRALGQAPEKPLKGQPASAQQKQERKHGFMGLKALLPITSSKKENDRKQALSTSMAYSVFTAHQSPFPT